MTPEQVHYGLAQKIYEDRCQVLLSAFEKIPDGFKCKVPKPQTLLKAAAIKGKFILSINDYPEMRKVFNGFKISPVQLKYSVSREKMTDAKEVLIRNF